MNLNDMQIPVVPLGLSLSGFFAVSYALCIFFGLLIPDGTLHHELFEMLPGFTWLDWSSFFVGLFWSITAGWYVALIFAPLFNYCVARQFKRNH